MKKTVRKTATKAVTLTVRIDESIVNRFDEQLKKDGFSRSEIIRYMIDEYSHGYKSIRIPRDEN